jgi:hypothetical protein
MSERWEPGAPGSTPPAAEAPKADKPAEIPMWTIVVGGVLAVVTELSSPYALGPGLAQAAFQDGGNTAIDQLFRKPS